MINLVFIDHFQDMQEDTFYGTQAREKVMVLRPVKTAYLKLAINRS